MIKLKRATCPASLTASHKTELAAARLHFEGTGAEGGFPFAAYSDPSIKEALSAMSDRKCAYCESDYDATEPFDVEHYRPKGAIDTAQGKQKPGYWWLASTWTNLLPSCIRCNRGEYLPLYDGTVVKMGKADLFPLADDAMRASAIDAEKKEKPLLINPCIEDPANFISFVIEEAGFCIAVPAAKNPNSLKAKRARASIDIYGLNREGLVRSRTRYHVRATRSLAKLHQLIIRLDELPEEEAARCAEVEGDIDDVLADLALLTEGDDRYTGMLRALIYPVLKELHLLSDQKAPIPDPVNA